MILYCRYSHNPAKHTYEIQALATLFFFCDPSFLLIAHDSVTKLTDPSNGTFHHDCSDCGPDAAM